VNGLPRGSGHLDQLLLRDRDSGQTDLVTAAGLFILIGAQPFTDWLPEAIKRDQSRGRRRGRWLNGDPPDPRLPGPRARTQRSVNPTLRRPLRAMRYLPGPIRLAPALLAGT
jgi:hypothetical protein